MIFQTEGETPQQIPQGFEKTEATLKPFEFGEAASASADRAYEAEQKARELQARVEQTKETSTASAAETSGKNVQTDPLEAASADAGTVAVGATNAGDVPQAGENLEANAPEGNAEGGGAEPATEAPESGESGQEQPEKGPGDFKTHGKYLEYKMDQAMAALQKKGAKPMEVFATVVQLLGAGSEYIKRAFNGTLDEKPQTETGTATGPAAPEVPVVAEGGSTRPGESPETQAKKAAGERVEGKRQREAVPAKGESTPAAPASAESLQDTASEPAPATGEKPKEAPKKGMTYAAIEKENKERIGVIDETMTKNTETLSTIESDLTKTTSQIGVLEQKVGENTDPGDADVRSLRLLKVQLPEMQKMAEEVKTAQEKLQAEKTKLEGENTYIREIRERNQKAVDLVQNNLNTMLTALKEKKNQTPDIAALVALLDGATIRLSDDLQGELALKGDALTALAKGSQGKVQFVNGKITVGQEKILTGKGANGERTMSIEDGMKLIGKLSPQAESGEEKPPAAKEVTVNKSPIASGEPSLSPEEIETTVRNYADVLKASIAEKAVDTEQLPIIRNSIFIEPSGENNKYIVTVDTGMLEGKVAEDTMQVLHDPALFRFSDRAANRVSTAPMTLDELGTFALKTLRGKLA